MHSSSLREQFPLWNCRHTSSVSHFVSLTEGMPSAMAKACDREGGCSKKNKIKKSDRTVLLAKTPKTVLWLLLRQGSVFSISRFQKDVDRSARMEQLNNCVELLFYQEPGLQPCRLRGTFLCQFSPSISIIDYPRCFFFNMLMWCRRGNRESSKADVCVPARRKAGKVKSPISTMSVFPKALPVCHLKETKNKTETSYDNSISAINTEITLYLVDL